MLDLLILAVPLLMLALLYCGWRGVSLFLSWVPAAAVVVRSDYGELQQQDDFWSLGNPFGRLRGWNWRDGEHSRLIENLVEYRDLDGTEHRATIERRVRRGWRPAGVITIWYDPATPAKATAFGPGYWFALALASACMLVSVVGAGLQVAGRV
ncbi:MAG: hypothetical protein JWN69_2172 [Alphaproteobacteria bacterium]|nr:hypothetical protein [Alphaproteobacteria bacterium]